LRVAFRKVVVRLCEGNVVLCFGKLYPQYHRRMLRFLVVDIGNIAYSTVQGLFLIKLHALKVFSSKKKKNILCARARVGLLASFVALLFVD
jgi:hypothetical protein